MAAEVILPKVDMDMATGKISKWWVAEVMEVKQGDPLFEIETDKAAMNIKAPASGILRNVVAEEGIAVPVGKALALGEDQGAWSKPSSMRRPGGCSALTWWGQRSPNSFRASSSPWASRPPKKN